MAKNFQKLWQDLTSLVDEAMAIRALAGILVDSEGRAFVSSLDRKSAEYCIDILDRGIAGGNLKTATEKHTFFITLRRLAGIHGKLPESMMISGEIEVQKQIFASGGFADVRSGTYKGHLVAVKTLRVAEIDDLRKIRKQFCKEVVLWSTLSHPHVLNLEGVYGDMERGQFITVSEWMQHGNIMEYIKKNPVNRLQLLHGAAQGLKYIHRAGLIHGDLKGANILMSNDNPPRACLADFGFMSMVLDPNKPLSCSAGMEGGTITFMSPELLVPSAFEVTNPTPTPEADVYAFGLVILQVLTGQIPFRGVRITELGFSVLKGLRPTKPANASAIGFSDSLWDFAQRCWDANMNTRPKVADVVTHLAKAAAGWQGLMPPCSQTEDVLCFSEEPMSDSMQHGGIFEQPSADPESPVTTSDPFPFSDPGSPSTVSTVPSPLEELPVNFVKPLPAPAPDRSVTSPRPPQEVLDDLEEFQHVFQNFKSPPRKLPQPKRRPFRGWGTKIRGFLGRLLDH